MENAEKGLELFFEQLEMLENGVEFPQVETLTGDELRLLEGKYVKTIPSGAEYLGYYFDPYCDVMVYEKEGKIYKVLSYIGE